MLKAGSRPVAASRKNRFMPCTWRTCSSALMAKTSAVNCSLDTNSWSAAPGRRRAVGASLAMT